MHLTVTHAWAERQGISLDDMVKQREAALPTGRRNDPEDIASMAAFLASDDAKNITSQAYNVDGGAIMIA